MSVFVWAVTHLHKMCGVFGQGLHKMLRLVEDLNCNIVQVGLVVIQEVKNPLEFLNQTITVHPALVLPQVCQLDHCTRSEGCAIPRCAGHTPVGSACESAKVIRDVAEPPTRCLPFFAVEYAKAWQQRPIQ